MVNYITRFLTWIGVLLGLIEARADDEANSIDADVAHPDASRSWMEPARNPRVATMQDSVTKAHRLHLIGEDFQLGAADVVHIGWNPKLATEYDDNDSSDTHVLVVATG